MHSGGYSRKESFKEGGQSNGKPYYPRSLAVVPRGGHRRWEIIDQALTAPRKAEDIARTGGVSLATVHRVIATYKQAGVAAIETAGKGGRRHQYLTLSQERAFLEPFLARAATAEMVTGAQIQRAFEEVVKQPGAPSTISRLLDRHGWRQLATRCRPAQAAVGKPLGGNAVATPERREPTSPKGKGACPTTVATPQPSKPSIPKATRQFSAQGYLSDLIDEEWTILEPLIPPSQEGILVARICVP